MRTAILVLMLLLLASAARAQAVDRPATWTDTSSNEANFIIQKCAGVCTASSTGWSQVGMVAANITSFLITGALPGSTTSYRVGATNSAGTGWSTVVTDILPLVIPTAPTIFTLPPCKLLTETAPGSGLYQCS